MTCLGKICQNSEYRANHIQKRHKYVGGRQPGEDACLAQLRACEDQAEQNLKDAVQHMGEEIKCDNDCDCYGKGDITQAPWENLLQQQIWKEDITKNNCRWEITLTYDLDYRESTPPGRCRKKPPRSPKP